MKGVLRGSPRAHMREGCTQNTSRRESNPRPFGPKPNTPTTTPHLDLLLRLISLFLGRGKGLGLHTAALGAHIVDVHVIFGLNCVQHIFFFFLTSPEGAGIPFGETFRSPEGYMHTPMGCAYTCPNGACVHVTSFFFDRTVDLRSPGF